MMTRDKAIRQMNRWGTERRPFYFLVDFCGDHVILTCDMAGDGIYFDFGSSRTDGQGGVSVSLEKHPLSVEEYKRKFDKVIHHIRYGDSFLVNLTVCTPITCSHSLEDLFGVSRARYKVWSEGRFVCFSPETFVRTKENRIYSHPMKGTIDAAIPDAANVIMRDTKELAEHVTIVDLIRNDLSRVASGVKVDRFRYIDTIIAHDKTLLQVSSQISGDLPDDWQSGLGDLVFTLLPAGSVTGAPKSKTLRIIEEVEGYPRGFYTGVAGYYDGEDLDTAVMIRFVEEVDGQMYFKSGGGITAFSDSRSEYQETLDKIYVPVY